MKPTETRLAQAKIMWRSLSDERKLHAEWRGTPKVAQEKQSSFPPTMWRSEWQEKVEFAAEEEGFYGVVPEEAEKNNREIKKVAMNVLQDKWKRSFATIVFANGGFANGAGRRIEKKGAVVGFAVVVAGGAKAERRAENEDGGRELPPTEGKKRRIKRGEIGSPLVELAFEGAEGGVNAEATEEDGDGK